MNKKGNGGKLKARAGTGWILEVKWTPKRSKNRPSEIESWKGGYEIIGSGTTIEVCDGGRGPGQVQYAFKENEKRY